MSDEESMVKRMDEWIDLVESHPHAEPEKFVLSRASRRHFFHEIQKGSRADYKREEVEIDGEVFKAATYHDIPIMTIRSGEDVCFLEWEWSS